MTDQKPCEAVAAETTSWGYKDGQITLRKVLGHLCTITEHKKLVFQGCARVGLYYQGITHDLSKFSPVEFVNGCRYYQGGKRSPNNGEREAKGYSEAWMHHKGRNRHHLEYWNDYRMRPAEGESPLQLVKMPRRYVAEMLMDRIAASKTYLKEKYNDHEPLQYFLNGKSRLLLNEESSMELERMLRILDRKGEEYLYRFVREYYLKGYPMK